MAATLTSTGITFSDGTSLNSAAPAFGEIGTYAWLAPISTVSYSANSGTATLQSLTAGTTIAGSALGYNISTAAVNAYNTESGGMNSPGSFSMTTSTTGFTRNSTTGTSHVFGTSYTSPSGSWRSMSGCGIYGRAFSTKTGYYRQVVRSCGLFLRYA